MEIIRNYLLCLLFALNCFAQVNKVEEKKINFTSKGLNLAGTLFFPTGENKFPAVVILQGGSSNFDTQRSTSEYYAYKLVKNGIAALIYDKRGTGDSEGDFSKATFDDLVVDAINAVKFLMKQDKNSPSKVGIFGPSQGGRIAALAAAECSDVAFIATLSTPLVSIADLCYFSSMGSLKMMGIEDSVETLVEPLWKKHYALVESGDNGGLKKLDLEIDKFYKSVDTIFLPLKSEKLDHLKDFQLGDFQPQYNSMQKDYITPLSKVQIPWLNIYGEFDNAVPVEASIKIMKEQMTIRKNNKYEVIIIPGVNHGFVNVESKEYFPVEDMIIEWILKDIDN